VLGATFAADFSAVERGIRDTVVEFKTLEISAANAQKGVNRVGEGFTGRKIITEALQAAKAVEAIGGATRLTEAEQRRLTASVDEAIAKYRALGQQVPAELVALRGELQAITDENDRIKELAELQKRVAENTSEIAPAAEASGLSFGKLVASYVTAEAILRGLAAAGRMAIEFVTSSIDSYAAAEAATRKLTTALRTQGRTTPEVLGQYEDLAGVFQDTTVFADDLLTEMQALFVQVGDVGPGQMREALTAATDLAAGLGIDLETATQVVAKAMSGSTGALSRYGIQIDEARVATEGANVIFEEIEQRFGGQAQAQLETYTGRVQQLANAWDDVKESIGEAAVTNEITEFALNRLSELLEKTSEDSDDTTISLGAMWMAAGGDTFRGLALAALESYLGMLNEVDAAARRLPRGPGLPVAPSLPKIDAAGFQEFKRWNDEVERSKKLAAEAEKAYREWAAEVTGLKREMDTAQLEQRFLRLNASGKLNAEATKAIITEYNKLRPTLRELNPTLELIRTDYQEVIESARVVAFSQRAVNEALADGHRMWVLGQHAVKGFHQEVPLASRALIDLARGIDTMPGKLQSMNVAAQLAGKSFGTTFKENLTKSLGNVSDIIVQSLIEGADFEQVASAVGAEIGSAIGKSVGTSIGNKFGETLGGPLGGAIGEALGSLIGPLISKLIKTRAEKTVERVAYEFGVSISVELAKGIEDTAKDLFGGNRQAAKIFHLDDIISEAGGLNTRNFDELFARLRDTFVMIETGAFNAADGQQVLNDTFAEFAEFVTRDGALASRQLLEIIELNDRFGTQSAAVADFVTSNVERALGGLTTFLENAKVSTEASAQAIGAAAFGAFEALQRQGVSPLDAFKQIEPVLQKLDEQLKATGFDGGEAFAQLQAYAALASDEIAGPMLQGVAGLNDALGGLHNAGVLNQEMFEGLASEVGNTYQQLLAQGKGGAEALALMQPTLQTIWELQQDFGYTVDDTTQKLLDQAEEAGRVGDEHRSVQEQMLLAMQDVRDVLVGIGELFGVTLPQQAKEGAGKIQNELDGITVPKLPPLKVRYDLDLPNPDRVPSGLPSGGDYQNPLPGRDHGSPGFAFENWGRESLVRLHGMEAVVRQDQKDAAARAWLGDEPPVTVALAPGSVVVQVGTGQNASAIADGILRGLTEKIGSRDLSAVRFVTAVQQTAAVLRR